MPDLLRLLDASGVAAECSHRQTFNPPSYSSACAV
jgi:hypothetical protein